MASSVIFAQFSQLPNVTVWSMFICWLKSYFMNVHHFFEETLRPSLSGIPDALLRE
jgi:hypothetical protein